MSDRPAVSIRPATAADAARLVTLTRALAAYHGHPEAATLTEADLLRDGFGERPIIWFWIAETADSEAVGFVQASEGYAAWLGRRNLVVSNLYLDERMRGTGLGRRLMQEAARFAAARGITRIELHVSEWNPARRFYEAIGFRVKDDLRCRIEGPALDRLTRGA